MSILVDDGCFWTCPTERGARSNNQLQVLVRFLLTENSFGDLKNHGALAV